MSVPKVLSQNYLISSNNKYSDSTSCCSPSCSPNAITPPFSKTSCRSNNFSQQEKYVNWNLETRKQNKNDTTDQLASFNSQSNKNNLSNESKINSLFEELISLEQNSQRFYNSFRSISSKAEYQIQTQNLSLSVLGHQIIELRIDLKERQKDIRLLIEMIGSKNKLSCIVDRSTDTEQSSKSTFSNYNKTRTTITKTKSQHKSKKYSPKSSVRIFNQV